MKRFLVILGLGAALVAAMLALGRGERETSPAPQNKQDISSEHKERIRRFWEVYREATLSKQTGQWEQAAAGYREALAIDPRHEDALYYLGNALFELGRYEEAAAFWRQLAEVNPLSARAHAQLGAVYSCRAPGAPFDLDIAEQECRRALAINQEESGPVLKLGEVLLLKGDLEQARSYFLAASRTNFKSVEAHYLAGYIAWRKGERAGALSALQKAVILSQAERPPAGVPGEGDTKKKAAQPILSEGAGRKSSFTPYWSALKDWKEGDASPERTDAEYGRVDRLLRGLPAVARGAVSGS